MTDETALEILSHDRERLIDARGSDYSGVEALDMAITSFKHTRWIPVSERVPEEGEEVLCFLDSDEMAVLFRRNNWCYVEWVDGGFATGSYDVIAWMPLPEPYKKEGE